MFNAPPLVLYQTCEEYKQHYEAHLHRSTIVTADGIRVFFGEQKFWHAFCTRDAKGKKDQFSFERAKYIGWIKPTLQHPNAQLFQGWNNTTQRIEPHRRVSFVYECFVVVVEIYINQKGEMAAKFITAFYADNSIRKITNSRRWTKDDCLKHLLGEKK
jgi:hypothetical protein